MNFDTDLIIVFTFPLVIGLLVLGADQHTGVTVVRNGSVEEPSPSRWES